MIRYALAPALFLLAAAIGSSPAPAGKARWVVTQRSHWCSLFRIPDGRQDPIFELRDPPAAESFSMLVPMPAARARKIEDPQIVLEPSGEALKGRPRADSIIRGTAFWDALLLSIGMESRLEPLKQASAIVVRTKDGVVAKVDIPAIEAALSALRKCEDTLLARWGFDVPAYRALARRSRPLDRGHWFNPDDYPVGALLELRAGVTVARVSVSETGTVTDCTVVASSGSDLLDWQTCDKLRQRARFEPALDSAGRAVRSQAAAIATYRWS
jgi:hypothetical protein